jgi:Leucine-rich repeat (LRR) protein
VSIKTKHLRGFSNRDVKIVKITRERLIFIPAGFSAFLPNINELYIMSSGLKFISRSNFKELKNLKSISFYRNKIDELPENVFYDLTKLEFLSFNENQIVDLPPFVFYRLKNLVELSLRKNKLYWIPAGVFKGNKKLKYLSLSHNEINWISVSMILNLPYLETLTLYENTCINEEFRFPRDLKNETLDLITKSCEIGSDEERFDCSTIMVSRRNEIIEAEKEKSLLRSLK